MSSTGKAFATSTSPLVAGGSATAAGAAAYGTQPGMSTAAAAFSTAPMALQRSYAHKIELPSNTNGAVYEACMGGLGACLGGLGMVPCCFCFPNPFKVVPQGSVGLISRFGRYYRSVDPGLVKVNVVTEQLRTVGVAVQIETIPQQLVMSKDNVNLSIDSVIFWEVVDPYSATFLVADVRKALSERTQTTLRHIFGGRTLQDCIENRETIAHEIQSIIEEPARAWGVKIESILIKDMQFSRELQETLSAAAKQKRIGESKVIIAQAEVESAKLMREASDILNTPAAMQIRYLETLSSMAKSSGTKVIFMPTSSTGDAVSGGHGSSSSHGATFSINQAAILEQLGNTK
ncbi:hypothetical protein HK405_008290 [Cladochytrium tenue]|nr:hypothetical protein HK405_008290 [Cladochytrium tenue]